MKKVKNTNLKTSVNDLKKQLLSIRLNGAVSGVAKSHEKKNIKKDIARLLSGTNK
jgi:ribosomal protein L29